MDRAAEANIERTVRSIGPAKVHLLWIMCQLHSRNMLRKMKCLCRPSLFKLEKDFEHTVRLADQPPKRREYSPHGIHRGTNAKGIYPHRKKCEAKIECLMRRQKEKKNQCASPESNRGPMQRSIDSERE